VAGIALETARAGEVEIHTGKDGRIQGENMNKEFSTDIEPSHEWGDLFLDITR